MKGCTQDGTSLMAKTFSSTGSIAPASRDGPADGQPDGEVEPADGVEPAAPGPLEPAVPESAEPAAPGSMEPAGGCGSAGRRMDLESGDGLIEGLHRCSRETPGRIDCLVEPTLASESAASLFA